MNWEELLVIMLGSGVVSTILNILYQSLVSSSTAAQQRFYDIYILNGLYNIETAINEYGTATTTVFSDLVQDIKKNYYESDKEIKIQKVIDKICKRELVIDLMNRNYKMTRGNLPRIQYFGMELYNASIRTINTFSKYLLDNLRIDNIIEQIDSSINQGYDEKWFSDRLLDTAKILQRNQIYIQRKFRFLDEYLYNTGYKKYLNSLYVKKDNNLKKFNDEIQEYIQLHDDWMEKQNPETSLKLSKWTSDHIDSNPLLA